LAGNKAYLNCLQRRQAQEIWWNKLTQCGYFQNVPTEMVSTERLLGRVTASCVYAKRSVPHYNGSAMDGIAVWAPDTFGAQDTSPRSLKLLSPDEPFAPGCCYMVDTGDVMPTGTNAVIMIEDVQKSDGNMEIIAAAAPWQHVRIIGEDIVANELVVPEHHIINPVDIAALLSSGLESVDVVKRPRVAIVATGDEIVETSKKLKPGTILDVNSHMLTAAVSDWGGQVIRSGIVSDDSRAIKRAVAAGLQEADMVIVSAGTSAGRDDYTASVLAEIGEILAHGVAIKPGKPVILSICQEKPVIGLPGYPVSAMLTAELFARDVLFARQKLPSPELSEVNATLAKQVASNIGVEEYVRVSVGRVGGKMVAAPLSRGAGLISSLSKAQGIISIDESSPGMNAGETVKVRLLRKNKPENTIRAVGSHDLALELLGVFLRRKSEQVLLSCANVGSMGGVMAIRNGECHIAGIHLLDDKTGIYNQSFVDKYLPDVSWMLVHMAMRRQGLIVAPGNPKNINGLADLARKDVLYVNRQRGSGTRMLLDYEMMKNNIPISQISGYEKEVSTHMAVAASVSAETADAGLGVLAAANALGLDFITVADEQYDLLLNFAPDDIRLQWILDILQDAEFRRDVEALGGYDMNDSGRVIKGNCGG